MHFTGKSYSLQLLSGCHFSLFLNLMMHNCAIRPCSIQFAKKVKLDRNQLLYSQKLSIMRFLHYSTVVGQLPGHLLPFGPLPVETYLATIGA